MKLVRTMEGIQNYKIIKSHPTPNQPWLSVGGDSLAEDAENESEYLPAVAEAVHEEVDAAVDAEQKVADQQDLGADRNTLPCDS